MSQTVMSETHVRARRGASRSAIAAWIICGASVLIATGRLVLAIADPASSDASSAPGVPGGGVPVAAFEVAALTVIAVVGAVVASRQPRNPIGWIFSSIAFFLGLLVLCSHLYWSVALREHEPNMLAGAAAWLAAWIWLPAMLPALTLLPLYFPTGRPPTPRWRGIQWLVVAAGLALFLGSAFVAENGKYEDFPIRNPLAPTGALGEALEITGLAGFFMMLVAMLASAASLVVRYRRAASAERQQIKWVVTAMVLFAVNFVFPIDLIAGEDAGFASLLIGLMIIAVAVAIAILRYRLYDIDVVISRTLLVAGLSAFITLSYVTIVVGVGSLFGGGDESNLGLSLAATAFVAVAFQPVRRRLRRLANRLVFGRRSTPYDVLSRFATGVGAAEASPERLLGVAELMADGTGARPARVWLRVGSRLRAAASWPSDEGGNRPMERAADDLTTLPDADVAVPVREGDELLGVLTIAKPRGERVTEVDVDLVERLASASAVLLRNLRLDAELAQRLEEIQASSRRLVTAQDDARQRIETELGGGARAHLETLHDELSLLTRDLDDGSAPQTAAMLTQLATSTQRALDTLAGLAAGVYPPRLAADGLVAALSEQAAHAAVPVEVHADGMEPLPTEVEAAVYFAVLEALQNVAKYGGQGVTARVRLACEAGQLSFEVSDDGAGFDPDRVTLGTGVQGITDRLNAVGGTATINSAPGRGTTVAGSVSVRVGATP